MYLCHLKIRVKHIQHSVQRIVYDGGMQEQRMNERCGVIKKKAERRGEVKSTSDDQSLSSTHLSIPTIKPRWTVPKILEHHRRCLTATQLSDQPNKSTGIWMPSPANSVNVCQ